MKKKENYAQIGLAYGKTSKKLRLAKRKKVLKNNENYAQIGLVFAISKAKKLMKKEKLRTNRINLWKNKAKICG
jgi:hypothetical protein